MAEPNGTIIVTLRADTRRFDRAMRRVQWSLWWLSTRLAWRDLRRAVGRLARQAIAGLQLLVKEARRG